MAPDETCVDCLRSKANIGRYIQRPLCAFALLSFPETLYCLYKKKSCFQTLDVVVSRVATIHHLKYNMYLYTRATIRYIIDTLLHVTSDQLIYLLIGTTPKFVCLASWIICNMRMRCKKDGFCFSIQWLKWRTCVRTYKIQQFFIAYTEHIVCYHNTVAYCSNINIHVVTRNIVVYRCIVAAQVVRLPNLGSGVI